MARARGGRAVSAYSVDAVMEGWLWLAAFLIALAILFGGE
jgi:hypothetical protein